MTGIKVVKLGEGKLAVGLTLRIAQSVEMTFAAKQAGFDWLFLDMEHGVMSLEACAQISAAALDAGINFVDTADVYGLDWGGTGFGTCEERLGAVLATADAQTPAASAVAQVEVNRDTGRIYVRKFTVAHDCGVVVNPAGLRMAIEYFCQMSGLTTSPAAANALP